MARMIAERAEQGTKVIRMADSMRSRHVAALIGIGQEGNGNAAMQSDVKEAAVDDESDTMHDARFFEHDQQQNQRQHVGDDDADQTDQSFGHGTADDARCRFRLPLLHPVCQARRSQ